MSRIPKTRCPLCDKRTYHTEEEAREALGRVLNGHWSGIKDPRRFSLTPIRCPHGKGWHLAHNTDTLAAFRRKK